MPPTDKPGPGPANAQADAAAGVAAPASWPVALDRDQVLDDWVGLLRRHLLDASPLTREAVLLAAGELGKRLLAAGAVADDLLALHLQAQARLAQACDPGAARSDEDRHLCLALARGDALPLLLALQLPQQLDEHRRAETRWMAEHGKVRAMLAQTDDLVLVFDADGGLDYLNPAFERATGFTAGQPGLTPERLWPHPWPRRQTRHFTAEQPRADGSSFLASWSASPVQDHDGTCLSLICIGRDISQWHRFEQGVRQNEKLRAVATMAAGVAHDFNNLLGSIIGLSELASLSAPAGSAQARQLQGVLQASRRAADLVGDLLSFARESPPVLAPVSLFALASAGEALFASQLPAGVRLVLDLEQDAEVMAEGGQLEQVLTNLVRNAGYALRRQGGEVRLRVDRAPAPGPGPGDAAPARVDGRTMARVQVIDHGEGIPPDVLPRIFDPFFTTKPVGEGTGLGLSAAHGIVRHHQGQLQAASPPGGPTVFTLWLPQHGASGSA